MSFNALLSKEAERRKTSKDAEARDAAAAKAKAKPAEKDVEGQTEDQ